MKQPFLCVGLVAGLFCAGGCGPTANAEQPQAVVSTQSSSGKVAARASAPVSATVSAEPPLVPSAVASSSASGVASANVAAPLIQDAVEFDFGSYPRKLTAKEREFLGMIWMLVGRQEAVTLLTRSTTKQNADGWLALLGDHLVALGVEESKLTKVACVEPKAKRVFSQVRKSPASCADVVDDFQKPAR